MRKLRYREAEKLLEDYRLSQWQKPDSLIQELMLTIVFKSLLVSSIGISAHQLLVNWSVLICCQETVLIWARKTEKKSLTPLCTWSSLLLLIFQSGSKPLYNNKLFSIVCASRNNTFNWEGANLKQIHVIGKCVSHKKSKAFKYLDRWG